jgi:hypothetical protein
MLSPMYTLCILINRFLDPAGTLMKLYSFQAVWRLKIESCRIAFSIAKLAECLQFEKDEGFGSA